VVVNVGKESEDLSQSCDNPPDDEVGDYSKMSAERFDDAMATLTFTAMVITIALGFLFNL
jgi:hypothetical protein